MLTRFLLEEAAGTTPANTGVGNTWWIYIVLILLVVAMLVLPTITNRRREKEYNSMLDKIRVGDEVRTIGGVIGRITKISEKNGIKSFILETGARGSKTTMEFDMAAIGVVLKSTYVEEEKKDDISEDKADGAEPAEAEASEGEITTEIVEATQEKEVKKPAKKTSAKKSTGKKTSAKKTTKK